MKRVMIVGGPGSGKSTLARFIGEVTGLPVHHMDHLHWMPGWAERPRAEKLAMAQAIECSDAWIFEGGLSATYDHRAACADTLIWLDLPVLLRLWRVTARLYRYYGRTRPDMAAGCVEELHGETFEFYHYIWRTRQSNRERLQNLMARHPHLDCHHLTSRSQVASYMQRLKPQGPLGARQ